MRPHRKTEHQHHYAENRPDSEENPHRTLRPKPRHNHVAARRRLIGVYMETKDYAHALNHLNALLATDPKDAEARRLTLECRRRASRQVNRGPATVTEPSK